MRIKNFLLLLLGIALVAAAVWFYTENRAGLDLRISLFQWETSVLMLMVFSFGAGVLFLLPFWIYRDFQLAGERWRERRRRKALNHVEEAYRAGTAAAAHHRYSEAERHLKSLLERAPEHRDALVFLGRVLREQEKFEQAAECHRKAIRLNEADLEAHYALAADLEAAGELSAAEGIYRKIIERRPKRSVAAYEKLRDLYVRLGSWSQALEVQERLEKLSISDKERMERIRRARLGLEYESLKEKLGAGDTKFAVSRLKKMVKAEPSFTPAYVLLHEALGEMGKSEEAERWCREGYAATGSPVFLKLLEDHYLELQDPGGAIAAFKALVGRRRSDVLPRFFLGRLYNRLEMNNEAWDIFTQLQSEQPDSPTVNYYVAQVHERRGEHEQACELYRKVLQDTEGLRVWYKCTGCDHETPGWQPYCDNCKAWDTYQVEWIEPTSPQDLDVGQVRPVWGSAEPVLETA